MPVPDVMEKLSGRVNEIVIGATKELGGTRTKAVRMGGESGFPLLGFEAEYPNKPAIALEINNLGVDDWPSEAKKHVTDVAGDVGRWAARCEEWGADLLISIQLWPVSTGVPW